jgi:hypothetical protein
MASILIIMATTNNDDMLEEKRCNTFRRSFSIKTFLPADIMYIYIMYEVQHNVLQSILHFVYIVSSKTLTYIYLIRRHLYIAYSVFKINDTRHTILT